MLWGIGLFFFDLTVFLIIDKPLGAYFLLTVLLVTPVLASLAYYYANARRRVEPLESGDILGPKSYELTDEGFVFASRNMNTIIGWAAIISVEETPHHLFLFTDRCAGVVVPKRSFDSPNQVAEFRAFADARVTADEGA